MIPADEAAARAWLRAELCIDCVAEERLELFVNLLIEENQRQNLVAKASLASVWQRHVVDSAQLLDVSRETLPPGRWLDLGTGAGFPGLVIAVLQPDRPVTLVDSRRLRTDWLTRAARLLELRNVEVLHARVEELASSKWDVISARAFAPLEQLLKAAERFCTPDTLWLLPKGAKAQHELDGLGADWNHMFHVKQSLTDSAAGIITGQLLGRLATKQGSNVRQRGFSL